MPIRIEQPGAAKAAATAGTIIGKGQRAEEDRARAEREQARAQAEAAQKQARQVAMDWELQKMQINSQRAFERELRVEDYRLMAEDRAAERAVERIEFSKDLEFQYETQERQRKRSVLDASEAGLDNSIEKGEHTEDELAVRNKRTEYKARRLAIELDQPFVDPIARQQAANREERAQESAARQAEVHEERIPKIPVTPEDQELAARRKRVVDVMGSAYRDVPLDEAEAEMRELGLISTRAPNEVIAPLPPEELKASAVGKSAAERKAIYDRGVSLGYWN